ncbi:protein stum [Anopheles darlingi]|uniref:protein stum n=1 Tax=Anopheles darlingi TaxID=43151 RepID=UPI002100672F|nr:protein stum [Anopheles darlingi]
MYSQHDERSSTARTSATAASTAPRHYQHHGYDGSVRGHHHQHARHLDGYGGSISTPSSSLENQRSLEHSTASTATATTTSLFGDPVLPATRHTDLLGGEDLYQNLKHNIEQYHAKLYSEQEKQRQAERDALFDRYTSRPLEGGGGGFHRAASAVGHAGEPTPMGDGVGSASVYGALPARSRSFARTQSAGLAADINGNRTNLLDLDLLKKNDWIDFTEHEYQHSLIPTNSRTVADVQQLASGIMSRRIENGVFQNPRAAAAARTLRRSSTTDSSLYGMAGGIGVGGTGTFDERATFTVLGHGVGYDEGHAVSTSNSETNSEYERMLRYGRTDPSTAIIRDKINTGSNYRVSDARQHKNTAFTIINEVLPKSSSFDMAAGNRYSPYRDKHQAASSRILSASSATGGIMPVHPGFYGYAYVGGSGESGQEDGGGSSIVSAPLGVGRRRLSHSDLSLTSAAGHGPKKSKTSLSIPSKHPGRRQRGVLEVLHKKSTGGQPGPHSAKVTITQPSEDGRGSATPTPSETLSTGTTTDTEQRMVLIPEHQLRNLKLFGYKPFSSRHPPLSPVPDKGSMESSQADLKADGSTSSAGGGKKDDKSTLRAPVFNIRGLLLSPRRASKSKEASATSPVPGDKQQGAGETVKEEPAAAAAPAPGSPPKKRRFNLARAIIDSARRDSEGNGVKEKKKGAKGATKGSKGAAGGKKDAKKKTTPLATRRGPKSGQRHADDRYDEDDYYDPYEDHDRGKKGKRKTGTGSGGMLKSALSYAASFRSKSKGPEPRPGTARGRKQTAADSSRVGPSKAGGGGGGGGTPGSRRRGDTKSASRERADEGSRMGLRGKSGSKQQQSQQQQKGAGDRVKSGKGKASTTTMSSSMSRAKSAVGGRGRTMRRSSSAIAIDPGQQRKMNKLYEKNQKASGMMASGMSGTGGPSGGRATKNTSALVSERKAAAAGGGGLSKGDSRGELRGKSASGKGKTGADGSSGGPGTPAFEKRDSDRSLKKSDSNRSLAMGGKGKKSDSKSSLLNKRTDSRSSLHQTAGDGGDGTSTSGLDIGKSPLSSLGGGGTDGGALTDGGGVKSARPTPKLQSKGSLLSLLSLKSGSKRNLDRGGDATSAGGTDGQMMAGATSTMRLQSASVRAAAGAAGEGGAGGTDSGPDPGDVRGSKAAGMNEKPPSTKPLRRLLSRGSMLSIKSIAHARSFTNVRPPTAGGAGAGGTGGGASGTGGDGTGTMTKVTEGSQEHDDTTDTETSGHGGKATGSDGAGGAGGSMGVATHELTVAGDGEGEKVSNEYQGEPGGGMMRSPMAERNKRGVSPGPQDNVSSANTESMRDRMGGATGGPSGTASNNDEFEDEDTIKCSKCCCACCTPCWTRTCLPFRRCFRLSGCCGGRLGKRKADGERTTRPEPQRKTAGESERVGCWGRLLGCCRRCRNPKTSPETAVVARPVQQAAGEKKSCWQSLNCCSSCRRNKSRELVPRSSIDSDPADEEQQSRCRSCWSKLLCCCRPKQGGKGAATTTVKRHKMEEPVEMETVKCCFCFKRQRPKVKAKPKRKVPVRSTFNCLSCCMMCCRKKGDNQSRRTSNLSKKQSIAPTIPPEDLRPKIDMSLVEHSSLMRGAIPVLPICLAYFCLFLNVVVPGSGTVLSGGLCLCIGKPRFSQHDSIKGRIGSFIINCIVGVSQLFTIIFCVVGWGWAIWWGTIMLRLARQHRKILEMEAAQDEGEEQTTLSNRTGGSNPPVALVSKTHRDVETGR